MYLYLKFVMAFINPNFTRTKASLLFWWVKLKVVIPELRVQVVLINKRQKIEFFPLSIFSGQTKACEQNILN